MIGEPVKGKLCKRRVVCAFYEYPLTALGQYACRWGWGKAFLFPIPRDILRVSRGLRPLLAHYILDLSVPGGTRFQRPFFLSFGGLHYASFASFRSS